MMQDHASILTRTIEIPYAANQIVEQMMASNHQMQQFPKGSLD